MAKQKSYGNAAAYLVERLEREAPAFAAALARGKYRSARAAAIAAGILKEPTPLELARRAFAKLSKAEAKQFVRSLPDALVAEIGHTASATTPKRRSSPTSALTAAQEAKRTTLPQWQQPLYRGDEQDVHIWRLFTLERLRMEMAAEGRAWGLASQGHDMMVRAGILRHIPDRERLFAVLYTYGAMLASGEDVGDVTHPPWAEPGKSPFTRR